MLDHPPRELSNGQKQRTALARALVRGPDILLLDDPLRNVDAKLRYEMRLELPRAAETQFGSTVLYVTQDYQGGDGAGRPGRRALDGEFAQIDRRRAIYAEPANIEIARLFGDPTINLYRVGRGASTARRSRAVRPDDPTAAAGYAASAGRMYRWVSGRRPCRSTRAGAGWHRRRARCGDAAQRTHVRASCCTMDGGNEIAGVRGRRSRRAAPDAATATSALGSTASAAVRSRQRPAVHSARLHGERAP